MAFDADVLHFPRTGVAVLAGVDESDFNGLAHVGREIGRGIYPVPVVACGPCAHVELGPLAALLAHLYGESVGHGTVEEVGAVGEAQRGCGGLRQVDGGRDEPAFGCQFLAVDEAVGLHVAEGAVVAPYVATAGGFLHVVDGEVALAVGKRLAEERDVAADGRFGRVAATVNGGFGAGHGDALHPDGFGVVVDGDGDDAVCGRARKGVHLVGILRAAGDFRHVARELNAAHVDAEGVARTAGRGRDAHGRHLREALAGRQREHAGGIFRRAELNATGFVCAAPLYVILKLLRRDAGRPWQFTCPDSQVLVRKDRRHIGTHCSEHGGKEHREEQLQSVEFLHDFCWIK